MSIPFPALTPIERIEQISRFIKPKQTVAFFGKDISSSPAEERNFGFWVCSVDEKGNGTTDNRQDTLLNCSGTDSERGDVQFWMINDYNKKYQVRPATQREVDEYVAEGQQVYGVQYSRRQVPPHLVFMASEAEREKFFGSSNSSKVIMNEEDEKRQKLHENSGVHPFLNKHEEKQFGVYGIRIVRDYSLKAKALLAKLLKEIGENVGGGGN